MRLSSPQPATTTTAAGVTVAALLLFPGFASARGWDCQAVVDGLKFNFNALKGRHEIWVSEEKTTGVIHNTTYLINPCAPLGKTKHEDKEKQCPHGTRVCGLEHIIANNTSTLIDLIPVAGEYEKRSLDPKFTRLKMSNSNMDQGREGLRVELNGGMAHEKKQRAIVEFVCDPNRTGLEGLGGEEEEEDGGGEKKDGRRKREEDGTKKSEGDKDKEDDDKNKPSLRFIAWDRPWKSDVETLRLEWKTKQACEDYLKDGNGESKHWGFFTWIFVILFLGIAAYLVFGSWMNYSRYGLSGWDILPHRDTIQDLPYLAKDFFRRIVATVQGRSTRGGYSAV